MCVWVCVCVCVLIMKNFFDQALRDLAAMLDVGVPSAVLALTKLKTAKAQKRVVKRERDEVDDNADADAAAAAVEPAKKKAKASDRNRLRVPALRNESGKLLVWLCFCRRCTVNLFCFIVRKLTFYMLYINLQYVFFFSLYRLRSQAKLCLHCDVDSLAVAFSSIVFSSFQ